MNDDIRPLPNGDFEVITKAMKEKEEFERKIREAMRIPTPLLRVELDDFEKGLPGICERDFISAPPGISDDMPDCPLCEAGIPISNSDGIQWALVQLHNGKEYFFKGMSKDDRREWTSNNTACRLWQSQEAATKYAERSGLEEGTYGVRGLLTGG